MEPCTIVLFGASGDLTQRMVMPAIFRLTRRGLLSPECRVTGFARSRMTDDEFRERMRVAVMRDTHPGDEDAWTSFAARMSYLASDYDGDDAGYANLARRLEQSGDASGARRLFYLATPPAQFAPIMNHLRDAKLAGTAYPPPPGGWARIVIEKPFRHDLASARA